MDDLNRIADVLVCGILNRRFLPREDLVAYAVDAFRSIQAAQRERDAEIAETEADSAGRIYGEARDAAFNIAAAIRKQA